MEEEGIRVLFGIPNKKVHAKICIIHRRVNKKNQYYGFISTGNLNEKTAKIYADHCLLTSSTKLMSEVSKVFSYLENWQNGLKPIEKLKHLLVSPITMRREIKNNILREIKFAKQGKKASIVVKLNSLSDLQLTELLYTAKKAGVDVKLIIRGILTLKKKSSLNENLMAISIVDQYLEHARVMIFHNNGDSKVFISSADWMVRNLDHRIEVATPILDPRLKKELIDIIDIQLMDNQKSRILDSELTNKYVTSRGAKCRSQEKTYIYLKGKNKKVGTSSNRHRK
jgi:polyphosphate kinase